MVKVVGVRFKKAGKIYYFDPDETGIKAGDNAIVETARGVEFGLVVVGPKEIPEDEIVSPLKKVLRVATEEDLKVHAQNRVERDEAFKVCEEKVVEHELDMKLIDVEYTFDRNKLIFYFTADGRIDFRELVKDLAAVFRTRIELRQIGVRDEAKMLNGIGQCGRNLCCANWLGDFAPVSIKMAKDQNLSLNPTKISGICGRLMCCLKYEHETYIELRKGFPSDGDIIITPTGETGKVVHTTLLKGEVKIRLYEGKDKEGRSILSDDVISYNREEVIKKKFGEKPIEASRGAKAVRPQKNSKSKDFRSEKGSDSKTEGNNASKPYEKKNNSAHKKPYSKSKNRFNKRPLKENEDFSIDQKLKPVPNTPLKKEVVKKEIVNKEVTNKEIQNKQNTTDSSKTE